MTKWIGSAQERQRGLALVVVLWVVSLLALQVSLFNLSIRDASSLAGNELALLRGEELATAAVEIAVARMLERDPARQWVADEGRHEFELGDARLSVVIKDEAGRIDLNEADAELLAGLVRPFARGGTQTAQWVDRIMDWRDADSDRRPQGAEDIDYRRAGLGYGPTNGPFLDPWELGRVLGFPPEAAHSLASHLTVFGADGKVNPLFASRDVLLMLPSADPRQIDEILEMRRRGGEGALDATNTLGPWRNWLSGRKGPAFRIEVEVRGQSKPAIGSATAIVLIGKDPASPFRTLSWRYGPNM